MNALMTEAAAQPGACLQAYITVSQYGPTPWHGHVTTTQLRLLPVKVMSRPAPALSGQSRAQGGEEVRPPSALMMQHQAGMLERLICEAETALASQTVHSYRRWYSCWRRRGVRVSDLLDMTWAWRQRTSAD